MKHIKLFEEFKRLDEIVGKQGQGYDYKKEDVPEGLEKLWAAILSLVQTSPITFDIAKYKDYLQVSGPFNSWMNFGFNEKEKTYYVKSNKFDIVDASPEKVFKEAKKSIEFKYFLKGATQEKMKADRLKKILKDADKADDQDLNPLKLILDFLYYSEPERKAEQEDHSGPWATSGTSIDLYVYDLVPLYEIMDEELIQDLIKEHQDEIIKKLGHYANGMMSKKIEKYEIANSNLYIRVNTHIYYN